MAAFEKCAHNESNAAMSDCDVLFGFCMFFSPVCFSPLIRGDFHNMGPQKNVFFLL